ncbi:hypothetical protein QBC47DRAFT_97986 [Echria macrotheca]|uniref:Uncharacterized protein n=1 Tax=Echria macrotheca TaxID=438768 RepID=A0AAJ0F9G3_9PEZI|nr:hypothetical protein QBC47DRAFT_97986 [Echria macrotheca]
MPFSFSFSSTTSAAVVGSATVNGHGPTKGWAYKRESYANNEGSGVRTTKQKLGQAPVTKTKMYDAQGRPLVIEDSRRSGQGRVEDTVGEGRRIEDVTDYEEEGEVEGKNAK